MLTRLHRRRASPFNVGRKSERRSERIATMHGTASKEYLQKDQRIRRRQNYVKRVREVDNVGEAGVMKRPEERSSRNPTIRD